jgi:hypothetical protein
VSDEYGNVTPLDFAVDPAYDPPGGEVKNFALELKNLVFKVDAGDDAERFEAPPIIPPVILVRLAEQSKFAQDRSDMDKMLHAIAEIFRLMLLPESGERFAARLIDPEISRAKPVDLNRQVLPIMHWLLEEYGLRPTQPSSDSSTSSDGPESGTDSTAGAPPAELTPSV